MIDEVRDLIERYTEWLRDRTSLREVGEWIQITTPYMDRHNDYVQLYAKRSEGGFTLTDDGYTLQDLRMSGCNIDTVKRQALLHTTLNGFGVARDGEELTVRTTREQFAPKKHNLLQAVLAVNDLFYMAQPVVLSLFIEDVSGWFDAHEVRYFPQVKLTGKSTLDHYFDFVIPKSRVQPERLVRAINRPSRDTAEAAAFAWVDTREVRPEDSRLYAILNDAEQHVPGSVLDALLNYDVRPVLWSERERHAQEFAA